MIRRCRTGRTHRRAARARRIERRVQVRDEVDRRRTVDAVTVAMRCRAVQDAALHPLEVVRVADAAGDRPRPAARSATAPGSRARPQRPNFARSDARQARPVASPSPGDRDASATCVRAPGASGRSRVARPRAGCHPTGCAGRALRRAARSPGCSRDPSSAPPRMLAQVTALSTTAPFAVRAHRRACRPCEHADPRSRSRPAGASGRQGDARRVADELAAASTTRTAAPGTWSTLNRRGSGRSTWANTFQPGSISAAGLARST
jgi:hypothetical protein